MANKTPNYDLNKPLPDEFYDVEIQNNNMDQIDAEIWAVNGSIAGHKTDNQNPHGVTAVQVGADPVGSAAGVQNNLNIHAGNADLHGKGKKTATLVVGHAGSGHTSADVDFLCVGTDDQVQINAAIQALPEGGGKVLVLEGTYHLSDSVLVNRDDTTLEGLGAGTKLIFTGSDCAVYIGHRNPSIGQPSLEGCTISTFYIRGDTIGINGFRINKVTVTNNYLESCSNGINLSANEVVVAENTCVNCESAGIVLRVSSGVISNNMVRDGNGYGIQLPSVGLSNCLITSNLCMNNGGNGIQLIGTKHLVSGNICVDNEGYGIHVGSTTNCAVIANIFVDNALGNINNAGNTMVEANRTE